MSDAVLRYVKMLQHIPNHTGGITASAMRAKLLSLGFNIDKRSVERDLVNLSAKFPISSSDSRPAKWHWAMGAEQITLPGLDPASALTYELVARYLTPIVPRQVIAAMEPQFAAARKILDDKNPTRLGRWSSKIAVLAGTQPLLPPTLSPDVTDVVYASLLNSRRFEASYRAADASQTKRYPLNPLGLVMQEGVLYLVGTAWDYTEPCVYALHRMSKAVALDEPASVPDGFDLNRYVREEHVFEQPNGGDIRLELRVSPWMARYLDERKLATDQIFTPIRGSDHLRLRGTVPDTAQLRWWLRSFGTEVEVLKPAKLRKEMAGEFEALAQQYRT
jgi:predicted DNA-binding transcriptional regulator YafY